LVLGLAGPLVALGLFNTTWFGHPWNEAWRFTLGDGWQRTLSGLFTDTPLTALESSGRALLALAARHPLSVVGWLGLCLGMAFVPWRARISTFVLLVTLGGPALLERHETGLSAEEHPIALFAAFAAVGYLIVMALVARERPKLVPACALGGIALIGAGAAVSVLGNGASRPVIVAIGSNPAPFIAPVALCAAIIVLLLVPALHPPRIERERAAPLASVALILMMLLTSCGASSAPNASTSVEGPNLLPPIATRLTANVVNPLWTLDANAQTTGAGASLIAANAGGTATSPVVPVQAGEGYRASAHVVLNGGAKSGGTLHVQWLSMAQQPIDESLVSLVSGIAGADVAALPAAAYARVVVEVVPGAVIDEVRLTPRTGGRLDALPNYARAALSFSFDFETAMGGLIHTRGGTVDHDVADAESRALSMRAGALFLRGLFAAYDVRGTFYVNGYNFLTGNTQHRQFVGNPTYTRYGQSDGWASSYWATHPWYGDDPYGTEQSNPAWYFGSLTKQLAQDGNDIESHTFGHLFLHAGITAQELDADLTAWDALAKETGYAPAHSFAFPWRASNSLTEEYYAVLAKHGITTVTRYYDYDPKQGPYNYYPVPVYPQMRVVPDTELTERPGDEAIADRTIELALAQGGVVSIWAHPESIATPTAQAIWGRVVAYAADRRSLGLWVAPVTTIANFADARDHMRVSSMNVGATTLITVANGGSSGVSDATLTLPRVPKQVGWTGGSGQRDINGAQIRVGTLAAGEATTIEVRYP
jgi:peptidoglycan/xylan/chitin deacetylase (PgdA/CDA1 family)